MGESRYVWLLGLRCNDEQVVEIHVSEEHALRAGAAIVMDWSREETWVDVDAMDEKLAAGDYVGVLDLYEEQQDGDFGWEVSRKEVGPEAALMRKVLAERIADYRARIDEEPDSPEKRKARPIIDASDDFRVVFAAYQAYLEEAAYGR
jgi:hypothetical protein